jgi:hypothetical protein
MVVDPRIPSGRGRVFLKIKGSSGPPEGCRWAHLIAHGSPQHSRGTGFMKKAEPFLHLVLINPRIVHGIIGLTGLLEDWL